MDQPSPIAKEPEAQTGAGETSSGKPFGLGSNGLRMGTRLREFEVIKLIGEGGFGIVYLANDHVLERQVALKEFMPASLASRRSDLAVSVRASQAEPFQLGLKSFMNEARLLAQFDHPSLVRVYQFWEANGTAYMVMPYYRGTTMGRYLRDRRAHADAPPDEEWLRGLLMPLLDALETIHAAQCYHRDIAPDNILILEDTGRPLLLDFGSARRVIGDVTHALTAFVKPGFAPIEQYAQDDSMRQGPWTDIYALAATLYFAITGEVPVNATTRILGDQLPSLHKRMKGRYSDAFLEAIDLGLAVRPQHRLQNVATWRALATSTLKLDPNGPQGLSLELTTPPSRAAPAPRAMPSPGPTSAGAPTPRLPASRAPAPSVPDGTDRSQPAPKRLETGPTGRGGAAEAAPSSTPAPQAEVAEISLPPTTTGPKTPEPKVADATPSAPRRASRWAVPGLFALAIALAAVSGAYFFKNPSGATPQPGGAASAHAAPPSPSPAGGPGPAVGAGAAGTEVNGTEASGARATDAAGTTAGATAGTEVNGAAASGARATDAAGGTANPTAAAGAPDTTAGTQSPAAAGSAPANDPAAFAGRPAAGAPTVRAAARPNRNCDAILHRAANGERVSEEDLAYLENHCGD